MKRKWRIFAGLAALFFVAIIGFTGCDLDQEYDHEIFVKNQSSFTIRVEYLPEYDVSPRSFSLSPGAETVKREHRL